MMRLLFGSRRHLPIGHIGAPLAEQIEIFGFLFCPVDMGSPLSRVLLLSRNSENWCRIEVSAHTENLSCRGQVLGLIKPRSSEKLEPRLRRLRISFHTWLDEIGAESG